MCRRIPALHIKGDEYELRREGHRRAARALCRPAQVPAGRDRGPGDHRARARGPSRVRGGRAARAPGRAGAHRHVPRPVDRRFRQGPGQPRIPRRVQLRARPLQGRSALQPQGERGHAQVPRLRADLQEQPDHAAHGRRQGRFGLRSQGQVQPRDHGVLPVLHDRALPPYRPEHRRSRRRPGRGRPRDRLPVRSVQAPEERVERRAHGQGAVLRRLARPQRGDRVRPGVLRGRVPQVPGPLLRGQDRRGPRLGQRRDLRHPEGLAARRHGHRRLRHEGLDRGRRGHRLPRARGHLQQEALRPRPGREPGAVRRRPPGRRLARGRRARRVAAAVRYRAALRVREHAHARGRPGAGRQRLPHRGRGRQHAHDARCDRLPPAERGRLHARQGRQRRRRAGERP